MPKVPNERLNHYLAILADRIATEAHAGHLSDHNRRMARLVSGLDSVDEVDVAAAVLHDVLEDTALTAAGLADMLLAGGDPDAVTKVVALVKELSSPFCPASGLRRQEKHAKLREKLGAISERAKRLKLCDCLDTLVGGEAVPHHDLAGYLAECRLAVDLCGLADPILAGWLICEINAMERKIKES